ncbi:28S ribosomal protein S22, mitochondrial [Lates japonicus]
MAALGSARCLLRSYSRVKNAQKSKQIVMRCSVRTLCSGTQDNALPDNAKPQFTDPAVQDILSRITGLDLEKVFRPIKQELKPPKYKLMTDEQLKQAMEVATQQAKKLLQMPPRPAGEEAHQRCPVCG